MYIPNTNPYSFTASAVILGYLLTNEFTVDETVALGAWFNVVGDILVSNSAMSPLLQQRTVVDASSDDELDILKEAIDKLKENIEKMQKEKSNQ